ncbi:MAG: hypothetical protein A2175_00695 [Candidatus Nealsonbacteria bacterium RBG_13_42_11]|uniref:Uncharacterized protein n=1 Tax=Candidatus Nealsonbacteria bacterium RBG_13_42_11 TaxID=1801663 RepID=A0A1G2DYX2_9BACT|nr:MAG: hypothetical protein A2175_00695 [Candidatus Nealsonbacteria bacterium RBG_13_42_11]
MKTFWLRKEKEKRLELRDQQAALIKKVRLPCISVVIGCIYFKAGGFNPLCKHYIYNKGWWTERVQYEYDGILFFAFWNEKKKEWLKESLWSENEIMVSSLVISVNKATGWFLIEAARFLLI